MRVAPRHMLANPQIYVGNAQDQKIVAAMQQPTIICPDDIGGHRLYLNTVDSFCSYGVNIDQKIVTIAGNAP